MTVRAMMFLGLFAMCGATATLLFYMFIMKDKHVIALIVALFAFVGGRFVHVCFIFALVLVLLLVFRMFSTKQA